MADGPQTEQIQVFPTKEQLQKSRLDRVLDRAKTGLGWGGKFLESGVFDLSNRLNLLADASSQALAQTSANPEAIEEAIEYVMLADIYRHGTKLNPEAFVRSANHPIGNFDQGQWTRALLATYGSPLNNTEPVMEERRIEVSIHPQSGLEGLGDPYFLPALRDTIRNMGGKINQDGTYSLSTTFDSLVRTIPAVTSYPKAA